MSDISSSSFYGSMLSAIKPNDDINSIDLSAGYDDSFDSDLASLLDEHLDIEYDDAIALVGMAQDTAGGDDASIEDVLKEILTLLELGEDDEESEIESDVADDIELSTDDSEDDDSESDSSPTDGSFYDSMFSAITDSDSNIDADDEYSDEYNSLLMSILVSSLEITDEEAESVINIALASAGADGGDTTVENVLKSILTLFDINEDENVSDVNGDDVEDLDFSGFMVDTFTEIASGTSESGAAILTTDNADELATMLGLEESDAIELIEFSGGEIGQIIKFLFDGDKDGEISFEELVSDQNAISDNIQASKDFINEFDSFQSDNGYNFSMDDEGNVDENNIAHASVEDGEEAIIEYLESVVGIGDGEELLGELVENGLLTYGNGEEGNDTIGNLAFIQLKAMVSEYSMQAHLLDDDEKKDVFIASAEDAKTALEGTHGEGAWSDSGATEEMIAQIDEYYQGQMSIMESMSTNVQAAAEMASSLASSVGDISVGDGGGEAPVV